MLVHFIKQSHFINCDERKLITAGHFTVLAVSLLRKDRIIRFSVWTAFSWSKLFNIRNQFLRAIWNLFYAKVTIHTCVIGIFVLKNCSFYENIKHSNAIRCHAFLSIYISFIIIHICCTLYLMKLNSECNFVYTYIRAFIDVF